GIEQRSCRRPCDRSHREADAGLTVSNGGVRVNGDWSGRGSVLPGASLLPLVASPPCAPPMPEPRVEVAAVKPHHAGDPPTGGRLAGASFSMINETLGRLIAEAYGDPQALPRDRVIGGLSWIETDRFDVDAVASAPLDRPRADLMLRHLLAERFKLA